MQEENPRGESRTNRVKRMIGQILGKNLPSWDSEKDVRYTEGDRANMKERMGKVDAPTFLREMEKTIREETAKGKVMGKDFNVMWGIGQEKISEVSPILGASVHFSLFAQQIVCRHAEMAAATCPEHSGTKHHYANIIEAVFGVDKDGNQVIDHPHGGTALVEIISFLTVAFLKHVDLLRRSNWSVSSFFRFRFFEHQFIVYGNDGQGEDEREPSLHLYTPDDFPVNFFGKEPSEMAIY